jgi:Kef-type K+ transport system membrane component KefB
VSGSAIRNTRRGETPHVILEVFIIFVAAKAAAEIFVRLSLPAVVGELLVGVFLGPNVAGVIKVHEPTETLAQLGIVILLFTVGLETPVSGLLRVGRPAMTTSIAGILAAGATAVLVVTAFGHSVHQGLIAGTALAASSVGVGARVFQDLGLSGTEPARIVLGASVVDDVVALALFPFLFGLGQQGKSIGSVLTGLVGILGFVVLVIPGSRFTRRHPTFLDRPRVRRGPFVLALALCLGLAALAEQVGLAALVGAFLAGMVLAETRDRYELDRRMLPLFDFLVPFFFVEAGARLDPRRLASGNLTLTILLIAVTILAKMLAGAGGAVGLGWRERLQVGAGMVPRNEVALVVAAAGVASGALSTDTFSVVVGAVIVSTVCAGPLLRIFIPRTVRGPERALEGPPEAPGGEQGQNGP